MSAESQIKVLSKIKQKQADDVKDAIRKVNRDEQLRIVKEQEEREKQAREKARKEKEERERLEAERLRKELEF
jgi:hypothetical protein